MGRGPFVCIAAGPASALASLAGGGREHDGRRGHRPGRGLRGADVHGGARLADLEGTPGTAPSGWGQDSRAVVGLRAMGGCRGGLHRGHEVLEDHGHNPGTASARFATAHDLLAFLDQDLRPARTAISTPCPASPVTGMSGRSCTSSPSASGCDRPPTPSGLLTSDAAAPANPAPAAASSPRRSATANASCLPSCISGSCAPSTSSLTRSATSAAPPSATPSAKPGPSWDRTAASHPQRTDRRFASWCRITSGPGIEPLPGWASVAISQDQHNINS
jgi:hypothetical protein